LFIPFSIFVGGGEQLGLRGHFSRKIDLLLPEVLKLPFLKNYNTSNGNQLFTKGVPMEK